MDSGTAIRDAITHHAAAWQTGERDGEAAELERFLAYTVKDGLPHHRRAHDTDRALVDRYLRAP